MTNIIKGITVEIDGDTTGLNKALKEADKQAKIQLENGKLEQDKYDALQKEIIETENNLKALEEESGDKIKKVGDKTSEVGKGLSTHVTAGAATGEVNTRFGLTSQKLEELSGKFIKFAQLNNIDVSTTIDNTQEIISAFGLKAEDAGTLLDTMNAVGQRTSISIDALTKSMVTNSAALQKLGFLASDAANFLGNVEMSGADTSQVMTGLSKALSNATANGKPMKEALNDIHGSMIF